MPEQARLRIIQVFVVDEELLDRFGVGVSAIAEHPSVANQKRHPHKNAVRP
jgi:hypothetical protein